MSGGKWNLIVKGEIREGFRKKQAMLSFMKLSRMDPERVERVFREKKILRKRNLDEREARLQLEIFRRKGLVCYLEKAEGNEARPPGHFATAVASNNTSFHGVIDTQEKGHPERTPFLFFGTAKEYFFLWFSNLLLILCTAGFYWPWAKVRELRYLYGKTRLDGNGFCFQASPFELWKVYVFVELLLFGSGTAIWLDPLLGSALVVLSILLFPLFKHWQLRTFASNSTFLGERFDFTGTLVGAYEVYLLWPALTLLSGGLLYPQMLYQQKVYYWEGLRYGAVPFRLTLENRRLWYFHFRALVGMGLGMLIALPIAAVSWWLTLFWLGVVAFFSLGYLMVNHGNTIYGALSLGKYRFRRNFETFPWLGLHVGNVVAVLLSLGLLFPWAKMRTIRYRLHHTSLITVDEPKEMSMKPKEKG